MSHEGNLIKRTVGGRVADEKKTIFKFEIKTTLHDVSASEEKNWE